MSWLYSNLPQYCFDDTTSATSGGAPAPAPVGGDAGGVPAPDPNLRVPDSPTEPGDGHDAFEGMEDSDFDLVELPTEDVTDGESGAPPPKGPPKTAPAPPAAAAPKEGQPPPTAPQPPAPKQDATQQPRSALDTAIEGFKTNHKELSSWASTNLFALSKEDAEILETDAASFIPVLMGRVYSQALQATTNLMRHFVPDMVSQGVQTTTARQAKATEALSEFYAANNHLNPQQHGPLVDKWARAFRAANPSASRADAIKFVGNAVSSELGLAAPAGTNGAGKRSAPFAPARPGTRVPQPAPKNDPYEGMDMEYDN